VAATYRDGSRLRKSDFKEEAMIDIDWLREICLPLPGVTEQIQWGYDLVIKVGGKMFAVAPLEPAPVCLSFKCSDESFAELAERPKIIPAPYLARAKWVALESPDAITRGELSELLRASYQQVFAKLPKRTQQELKSQGSGNRTGHSSKPRPEKKTRKSAHHKNKN
jgi:predicted DNA-binding protein (MmcQ/YjbR family)